MPRFTRALPLVLLLLAASAAGVSAKKPTKVPKLKNTTIVEGQSLGGVELGGSKTSAVKAWGKPGRCVAGSCYWPNYTGGLSITIVGGKIVELDAGISPGMAPNIRARVLPLHTRAGVKLRDAYDKVKQTYPDAKSFSVGTETTSQALELLSGSSYTDFFFDANRRLRKISVSTQSAAHPL